MVQLQGPTVVRSAHQAAIPVPGHRDARVAGTPLPAEGRLRSIPRPALTGPKRSNQYLQPPADQPCSIHGHSCKQPPDPLLVAPYHSHMHVASGAFGRVYRSYSDVSANAAEGSTADTSSLDTNCIEAVALKVISKCTLGTSAAARRALRSEIDIHRNLSHPHIVRMRNVSQDRARVYLVLDYCSGPTLAAKVAQHGPLPEETARIYFLHLCRALHYLHSNEVSEGVGDEKAQGPVLHRDVKPDNILLSADLSVAMLCDFGLSQRVEPRGAPTNLPFVGTPNFLAPELVTSAAAAASAGVDAMGAGDDGDGVDTLGRSRGPTGRLPLTMHPVPLAIDCWAAGVVLYIMLFGISPFDTGDIGRTYRRIRAARLAFPVRPRVSSQAKHLIRALLARNPDQRLSMAAALRHPFLVHEPGLCDGRVSRLQWGVTQRAPDSLAQHARHLENSIEKGPDAQVEAPVKCPEELVKLKRMRSAHADRLDINRGVVTSSNQLHKRATRLPSTSEIAGQRSSRPRDRDEAKRLVSLHNTTRIDRGSGIARSNSTVDAENVASAANERDRLVPSPDNAVGLGTRVSAGTSGTVVELNGVRKSSGPFYPARSERSKSLMREPLLSHVGKGVGSGADGNPSGTGSTVGNNRRRMSSSIARCVAMYNNMLHKLNAGLELAETLFEQDTANTRSDEAAQARFAKVARRLAQDNAKQPIMVERWLDFSSSFGFATKMSDGRTGCCFNDSSIMFHWSTNREVPDVTYSSAADRGSFAGAGHSGRFSAWKGGGSGVAGRVPCAAVMASRGYEHDVDASTVHRPMCSGRVDAIDMTPRARSMTNQGSPTLAGPGHASQTSRMWRNESVGSSGLSTRDAFRSCRTFRSEVSEKVRILNKLRQKLDEADDSIAQQAVDENGCSTLPSSCSISFLGEDRQDPTCTESLLKIRGESPSNLVHVREWQRYKNPRAVAFRLSNDCIHVKVCVASTRRMGKTEEDFLLDAARQVIYYRGIDGNAWDCRLSDVADFCFSRRFHQRLSFCSRVLARFVPS